MTQEQGAVLIQRVGDVEQAVSALQSAFESDMLQVYQVEVWAMGLVIFLLSVYLAYRLGRGL